MSFFFHLWPPYMTLWIFWIFGLRVLWQVLWICKISKNIICNIFVSLNIFCFLIIFIFCIFCYFGKIFEVLKFSKISFLLLFNPNYMCFILTPTTLIHSEFFVWPCDSFYFRAFFVLFEHLENAFLIFFSNSHCSILLNVFYLMSPSMPFWF